MANYQTYQSNVAYSSYSLGGSSQTIKIEAWLKSDEALAKQLQEEENSVNSHIAIASEGFSGNASTESSSPVVENNSANNMEQVTRQDNVDPDNMAYEDLQALGEAVGTESRGLSDELVSYLSPFKYKSGGCFSRKKSQEECVICKSTYRNRQKLIKLPCQHVYHASCITRWLKINKACPICNEEVFG